jgi:sulfatase maturation enzyme AslB (radical SAM superfamily)
MYNFDGTVKNCIRSAGKLGDIKDTAIESILIDNNDIRQQHIVDRKPVSTCHTCYDIEQGKKGFDHISDRVFYIRELKNISTDTYKVGNFDLQTVDVRWSNLCNQACVYCRPEFSSKWASELKVKLDVPTEEQTTNFKEYIFNNAHQLKHVYMAGGEPLLMKENLELLELLDPSVNLRVNTNLNKVDTRIFDRICEFKNVQWIVSLETTGQEYEYIRYGGKWNDFLDNLKIIKQLHHKISFNMLHFLLNYRSVFDCVNFLKAQGFHNNSFIIGPLLGPEYLNIHNLPNSAIDDVKTTLSTQIANKPGYLLEDSYKNMLSYLDKPFNKNLSNSFEQIAKLDARRNLDSSKIFTELYEYR